MAKEEREKLKTCFVIAPIGDEGSEIRNRSDKVLRHIFKPVAEECGHKAVRADEISEPGMITSKVIQRVIDDDLVIADLTGGNSNVFYELAIRHMVKKPIVQIIRSGEPIPFDVSQTRTIHVDHLDLDSVDNCKKELIKHIRSAQKDPSKVDSPISSTVLLKSLHESKNLLEKSNAEIISMLQDLRSIIMQVSVVATEGPSAAFVREAGTGLLMGFRPLATALLDLPEKKLKHIKSHVSQYVGLLLAFANEFSLPEDICRDFTFFVDRYFKKIANKLQSKP